MNVPTPEVMSPPPIRLASAARRAAAVSLSSCADCADLRPCGGESELDGDSSPLSTAAWTSSDTDRERPKSPILTVPGVVVWG